MPASQCPQPSYAACLALAQSPCLQVSELSHKLGSSEGAGRSLEEELTRLRSQHQQLQRNKAERDGEVQDLRVRLQSAEEKVGPYGHTAVLLLLGHAGPVGQAAGIEEKVGICGGLNLLARSCRQLLLRGAGPAGQDAVRRGRGEASALGSGYHLLGQLLCRTYCSGCSKLRQSCSSGRDLWSLRAWP